MTQNISQELKEKQRILRQKIPLQQHEDFGQFCLSYIGNVNINQWSFQYIEELIGRYKQQKRQQTSQVQTSFYQYQTQPQEQVQKVSGSILAQLTESKKQNQIHNKKLPIQSVKKPKIKEKSAMELLDDMFNKTQTNFTKSSSQQTPRQQNFKTQPLSSTSFFDSNNFWATPLSKQQSLKDSRSSSFAYLQSQFFADFLNPNNKIQDNKKLNLSSNKPKVQTIKLQINQEVKNKPQIKSPYAKKSQHPTVEIIQQSKPQMLQIQKQINVSPIIVKPLHLQPQHVKQLPIKNQYPDFSEIQKSIQPSETAKKKYQKIPYQGSKVFTEQFQDSVPCFKSTIRNAMSHPNLSVTIDKHQIIHRNFFVPDYVMYHLKIMPADFTCKRNYQDFTKLRAALQRVYPGVQLPYLQKNSWLSETNADFIKKQKVMLQFFLNDIIYNKQLRNCRIFEDFLTLTQHKKMKRKFEQYDKMAQLIGIQQLCLLDGKVNVKLKQQQRIYEEKASSYIGDMQQFLQRQNKLLQTLSYQYQAILATYNSLSDLMKQMQKSTKTFNQHVTINEINNLQDVFVSMNKTYKEKYVQNKFDLDMLNKRLLPFIKYEKYNLTTLKQLIYVRNQITKQYLKRRQIQPIPNSKYVSDKLSQFKTGVLDESKNILVLKYQAGYLNNQVTVQSQRMFELMGEKIKKKYKYIAKKNLIRIEQSSKFWKQIEDQ